MYPQLDRASRDMILYFMKKHFPDPDHLVSVKPELDLPIQADPTMMVQVLTAETYKEDYKLLVKFVREHGAAVPPLVNAYMSLTPSMRSFGTALNPGFGAVEETGVLLPFVDMYEEKVKRHLEYDKNEIPSHLK